MGWFAAALGCSAGLACAAPAPPAASAALPRPVSDALAMLDAGRGSLASGWRYKQTISGGQHTEKLAYDAARPAGKRWRVLSVNGKAPTPQQARELARQAGTTRKQGRSGGLVKGVDNWLNESHYRLIKSGATQFVYQVQPRAGRNAGATTREMLKHLSGRFTVSRKDHRPVELTLQNYESFWPRFGVEIKSFELKIHFRRLAADGRPVVTDRISTEAKGKVFWLKGFDARTRVVLSDFVPVGGAHGPSSATAPKPVSVSN